MSYPNKRTLADKYLTARHADITVATASAYAVLAGQGDLIGVRTVTEGAITGADETLNVYKNGVDTGYDITVALTGAAAGNVDSVDIPVGAVSLKDGDYLTLVSANASGGTIAAGVTYIIRES
jgi:hypothetical protein